MHDVPAFLDFVLLPAFVRKAESLLSEADIIELEQSIERNPRAGDVIAGTGGVRKLRFAIGGRGKSGGVRVIYYHRSAKGRVYLITVYSKKEQDNLTAQEKKRMKQITVALDREA